ncbi:hypothetical protein MRB53_037054 [Persea americana]|nr:hypothetical protein MRB53_037054 [Persea americana]
MSRGEPVTKRRKLSASTECAAESSKAESDERQAVQSHPLGVKPFGNSYDASNNIKSSAGLFARLPDELLLHILESLEPLELLKLGASCKALFAFASFDELWRNLFIGSPPEGFRWRGTWRSSFLSLPDSIPSRKPVSCTGLFSDVLYRPFYCAHVPLEQYYLNIPPRNAIPKLRSLTHEDFERSWADRMFILTDPVKDWPAFHAWDSDSLLRDHSETLFRAEAVDWPLREYVAYMRNSEDESPLYLFDCRFAEKLNIGETREPEAGEHKSLPYSPPACFGPDLFSHLGTARPDSEWLIMGPARSGSTFHRDPNNTSAWNAVLRGRKYWIAFPSSSSLPPPPGVFVSNDQSEVTAPSSIAEWLLGFHAEARHTAGCQEGICEAGEVLHVPSGWYHMVVNLEESVALTGNFVPQKHLADVLSFLRDKPDQVSGFKEEQAIRAYELLVDGLKEAAPQALAAVTARIEAKEAKSWSKLTAGADAANTESMFSFGFELDDDSDHDDSHAKSVRRDVQSTILV